MVTVVCSMVPAADVESQKMFGETEPDDDWTQSVPQETPHRVSQEQRVQRLKRVGLRGAAASRRAASKPQYWKKDLRNELGERIRLWQKLGSTRTLAMLWMETPHRECDILDPSQRLMMR